MRGTPVRLRADAEVLGDLAPLPLDAARSAFLAVAGPEFEHDPFLDALLQSTLDGHALSIQIVAAQAAGSPSLAGLRERWNAERGAILKQEGAKEGRLTSVRASLALSLKSPRMAGHPLARRLLALLAYLPAGLAESDVKDLLGDRGAVSKAKESEAADRLRQMRLVESRVKGRLRMLTPLRESARLDVALHPPDRDRLLDRFLKLAEAGELIRTKDWARVREAVESESGNLDPVCELALRTTSRLDRVVNALVGAGKLSETSGLGSTHSLLRCVLDARIRAHPRLMARICFSIGVLASARSDYETARQRFEEALPLYRTVESVVGKAECSLRLGNLALRSDLEKARQHYEEALPLYRKAGSVLGEANCIHSMGELAMLGSDHEMARKQFEEALPLYQKVGDVLGEANGITKIGELAARGLDHDAARERFEEALLLYRKIGSLVGEGNCIYRLGELSWRLEPEAARERFQEALQLYRKIGTVISEANCIHSMGEIALSHADHSAARRHFEDALPLYQRVGALNGEACVLIRRGQLSQLSESGAARAHFDEALALLERNPKDLALPGWRAFHASLVAADPAIAAGKREEARAHWTRIGRLDLVDRFLDLPVGRDETGSAAA
jgi:tetratricopeptide (TPR) repeat protein